MSAGTARRVLAKTRPRPDLSFIHDRRVQFEEMGLEVQGAAQLHFDAEGGVKVIYTVAERRPSNDS